MKTALAKSLWLLFFSVIFCGVLYPLALWLIGQTLFPFQANGSLALNAQGKPLGSYLIAQSFTGEGYFHPRPSAASYNAAASSASNLAPSNPALRTRVETDLKQINIQGEVPADMVTTSSSGLDPHITLQNAYCQLPRVVHFHAQALHRSEEDVREEITKLLEQKAFAPLNGLGGEKIVNVLEINLALDGAL